MQRIFKLATGATLPVAQGNQELYQENAKFISLGDTAYARSAGVSYDGALQDGYKIEKKGNSVFITGGSNYSTLYGVYGLMQSLFDYEYYYKDTETCASRADLYLDEVSSFGGAPDFAGRAAGYGTMWAENDVVNPNRYGVKIYTNYFAPVSGQIFHNALEYAPYTKYGTSHSSWYASGGTQLCYTAGGNATEYAQLIDTVVASMKTAILADAGKQYIAFMGEDNHSVCTCGTCAFYKSYYGSDSAALILFINDVNAKIRAWIAEENVDTDIQICILAYLGYYQAPTENVDQLQLADGVSVLIAPIEIPYNMPFSEETKRNFNQWKAVTGKIGFWLYDSIWGNVEGVDSALLPFDSFTGMQERYQYVQSLGAEFIFVQGQSETYGLQSGFNNLKMYINSKLAWDTSADVTTLCNQFFAAFYGDGGREMQNLYDDMISYMQTFAEKGVYGEPYGGWNNKENWAKADILRWKGYIDSALSAVEPLKTTDSALYEKYRKHIVAERISLNYMLVKYHGDTLEDLEGVKAQAKEDIIASGIQYGASYGVALYNLLFA